MDISQNGANIVVETGSMISTRFELAFGVDSRRACDLVWRRGNTFGGKVLRVDLTTPSSGPTTNHPLPL
jgi:hypothetical protein